MVFTSLPILAVGLFEQDVNARLSLQFPILYQAGPKNIYFTRSLFLRSLLRGTVHSLIAFFCVYIALITGGQYAKDGKIQADLPTAGTMLAVTLTLLVNLQLAVETRYWTWINWVFFLYGPVSWFYIFSIVYNWDDWGLTYLSPFHGAFSHTLNSGVFWFSCILTLALTILPYMVLQYYAVRRNPTPSDRVREMHLIGQTPIAHAAVDYPDFANRSDDSR